MSSGVRDLGELPFLWRPLTAPEANIFPETLPFAVEEDDSGLVSQVNNPKVAKHLNLSYFAGTHFEGRMDRDGIGAKYTADFLAYISFALEGNLTGKSILEIGSGTGFLLSQLQELGGQVLGYEPGFEAIGKYDVEVIPDYFPSDAVADRRFDLVVAFALLEHMPAPRDLLVQLSNHVEDDGIVIIAVPDCQDQIRRGDPSMLIHEHVSYFTKSTLRSTAHSAGFTATDIRHSRFGGMIYGTLSRHPGEPIEQFSADRGFLDRLTSCLNLLQSYFERMNNRSVGVFVPSRAINSLHLCKDTIRDAQIDLRLFDDSTNLQGRYLPSLPICIEGRDELLQDPPQALLVYSYTFGELIVDQLKPVLPVVTQIATIADILRVA